MNRARAKRWARRAGFALGGALLFLALAIGGLMLWLGTDSARRLLLSFAEEALAGQGLYLEVAETSGRLPFSFGLTGLSLADAEGVWLELDEASLEFNPFPLFGLTVQVDSLSFDGLRLSRLPLLPSSGEEPEPAPSAGRGGFSLPVDLRLDGFRLSGAGVEPQVLAGLLPEREEALARLGVIALNAHASAKVRRGGILEPGGIMADLEAAVDLERGRLLDLALSTGPGRGLEDRLYLDLRLQEDGLGLLAGITGLDALPAYSLRLSSDSSLREIKLDYKLEAERLASLSGRASLTPASGGVKRSKSLKHLFSLDWRAVLNVTAEPGPLLSEPGSFFAVLPKMVLELVGPEITLDADVSSRVTDEAVTLRVESLRLENALALAGLGKADLRISGREDSRLDFSGALMARAMSGKLFEILGVQSAEAPVLGKSTLLLAGTAGLELGESPRVAFKFQGPLEAETSLSAGNVENLSFDLELDGEYAGELTLDRLRLAGMGLELDGRGNFAPDSLTLDFTADLSGERQGAWNDILRAFSDAVPTLGFRGSLTANLDAQQNITAGVRLAASEIVWPVQELEKALGGNMAIAAAFSGPLASPYTFKLEGLLAGPEPLLPGVYDPSAPPAHFTGLRARGEAELSLPGIAPRTPVDGWSASEQSRLISLNGKVDLALADAGLVLPDGAEFGGALRASASVKGVAGGDDTSLRLTAQLTNYTDEPLHSPLGELAVALGADADLTMRRGLEMLGRFNLDAISSKAGPIMLATGWQVDVPPQDSRHEGVTLALGNLDAGFAGLVVTGDAVAVLPAGSGAMPELSGKIAAHFENWKRLNEIFTSLELGVPAITGTPLDLVVDMESSGAKQNASLDLSLERLHMALGNESNFASLPAPGEEQPPLGTPGLLLLNSVKGQVAVKNLWKARLISAHLETGSGSANEEKWESFAVFLDLADKSGRVNLAVRNDGNALGFVQELNKHAPPFTPELIDEYLDGKLPQAAGPQPDDFEADAKAEAGLSESEMALVSAVFRLDPLTVRLDRAAMFIPGLNTGLYLRKPAFARFDDDIRVENVDFVILPGGYLRADAHFSQAQSSALAEIKDLPLALIRKLTGIFLPDGEVSLNSVMRMSGGEISGTSEINAILRPVNSLADLAGAPEPLRLRLNGSLGAESGEFKLPTGPGLMRLTGSGTLGDGAGPASTDMHLAFDLPLRSGSMGIPVPDSDAPLAASLGWRGEVGRFWALLPTADRHFNGVAQLDFKLGGSLARLEYGGSAYLTGGRYEDRVLGLMLADINLQALAGTQGSRVLLSAGDGDEGRIAFDAQIDDKGVINTGLGGGKPFAAPRFTARGQINHLAPLHRDDLFVRLSGLVDANGDLFTPHVTGKFEIEQANLNLLYGLGGGVTTLPVEERGEETAPAAAPRRGPTLDISVEAPRRFFVRGPIIDSEWQVSAAVSGSASSPDFSAVISPVRGFVDLLSRPFSFTRGQLKVWGGSDYLDSALDLTLTHTRQEISAVIRAGGSIRRPTLELSSTPPLPQDQILSQVLFGKDITQLSAIEALQVANGVRQLMSFGQGGVDVFGELRGFLGVDTLRIGSSGGSSQSGNISGSPDASAFGVGGGSNEQDAASGTTVEAGKYINDSIYVGVEQGTTENSTRVRVEVELRPNLTLQGSSGGQSSQVGLGWKRDY